MAMYNKNGKNHLFSLNYELILQREEEDPQYSFLEELSKVGDQKFRISTLNRLANYIGTDWKSFHAEGLGITDLVNVITECLKEEGFLSDSPDSK